MEGFVRDTALRKTIGVVDRVDADGVVLLHELLSGKRGFVANTTPINETAGAVKPGTHLDLDVEDHGNIMIVESAWTKRG